MNSFSTIHKSIIYLLFFFFYHSVCAQNFPHEFGKYSNEEFQLTKYDKDPSAEAVVIYDIGESFFVNNDNGFEIIFERKLKIKVFNKAGLKWAQFEIPYYLGDNGYEKVYDIIEHLLLWKKLSFYKVSECSLHCFKSYLSNRTQCLVSGYKLSNKEIVKSGVPQESVLGPAICRRHNHSYGR